MKLIFEKSVPGRRCTILPACDVESVSLPASLRRQTKPLLPEMSETDISRHYTELCKQVHGVNCGFYPLGSCTMKYNPRIDEEMAALPGFANVHPLSPAEDLDGMQQVLDTAAQYLCEITGMDGMTFQPAAGAQFLQRTGTFVQLLQRFRHRLQKQPPVPRQAHITARLLKQRYAQLAFQLGDGIV